MCTFGRLLGKSAFTVFINTVNRGYQNIEAHVILHHPSLFKGESGLPRASRSSIVSGLGRTSMVLGAEEPKI